MKYVKVQMDILRACEKERTYGKRNPWMYGLRDGYVDVIIDGHAIICIQDVLWLLNTEVVFNGKRPFNTKKIIREDIVDTLEETGIIKRVPGNGKKTRNLTMLSGEHGNVWIDTAYTTYFDASEASYTGAGTKEPVYVWENGVLAGVILPVLVNEE